MTKEQSISSSLALLSKWISVQSYADLWGCPRNNAGAHLRRLDAKGLVTRRKVPDKTGRGGRETHEYKISSVGRAFLKTSETKVKKTHKPPTQVEDTPCTKNPFLWRTYEQPVTAPVETGSGRVQGYNSRSYDLKTSDPELNRSWWRRIP